MVKQVFIVIKLIKIKIKVIDMPTIKSVGLQKKTVKLVSEFFENIKKLDEKNSSTAQMNLFYTVEDFFNAMNKLNKRELISLLEKHQFSNADPVQQAKYNEAFFCLVALIVNNYTESDLSRYFFPKEYSVENIPESKGSWRIVYWAKFLTYWLGSKLFNSRQFDLIKKDYVDRSTSIRIIKNSLNENDYYSVRNQDAGFNKCLKSIVNAFVEKRDPSFAYQPVSVDNNYDMTTINTQMSPPADSQQQENKGLLDNSAKQQKSETGTSSAASDSQPASPQLSSLGKDGIKGVEDNQNATPQTNNEEQLLPNTLQSNSISTLPSSIPAANVVAAAPPPPPPAPPPAPAPAQEKLVVDTEGRNALLAQIRQGMSLKKVPEPLAKAEVKADKSNLLQNIAVALESRRMAMGENEVEAYSDDNAFKQQDSSDADWSDEDAPDSVVARPLADKEAIAISKLFPTMRAALENEAQVTALLNLVEYRLTREYSQLAEEPEIANLLRIGFGIVTLEVSNNKQDKKEAEKCFNRFFSVKKKDQEYLAAKFLSDENDGPSSSRNLSVKNTN